MRVAVLVLLLLGLLAGPAAAQAPAPASPPAAAEAAPNRAEIESLIGVLENEAERAKLIQQLRLLLGAQAAAAPAENPVSELSQAALDSLAIRINRFSVEFWEALDLDTAHSRVLNWMKRLITDPMLRNQLLETLVRLLVVFGAAFAAEWVARLALKRPRTLLEDSMPARTWSKAGHLLLLGVVLLMPLALFAIAANLTLPATAALSGSSAGLTAELMAATLLNGFVLARAVALLARLILASHAPNLRMLPIDSETAQYLHIWVRRLTDLWIYGTTILAALLPLGLPRIGYQVSLRLLGLAVATLVIIFILQNRGLVARWMRGEGARTAPNGMERGVHRFRQALAAAWHVLAIFYVAASYLVWALDVPGGFAFIVERTIGTIVVALAISGIFLLLRLVIGRGFAVAEDLKASYPMLENRANLYLPMLRRVFGAIVWVVGAVVLLQIWGLDSLVWLYSNQGRRLVSTLLTIAFAIGFGVVAWEVASAVIERTLRRLDSLDSRNARLRTFLPLLRNVIFVTLIVIVGLTVLSELGVNIAPLLAGAGVVGLAVGFGSQALVKDVITGLFILFEDTINVGDVVDLDGKTGAVEAITIRTIRLRDGQGSQLTIPFSAVTTIKNMTREYAYYPFNLSIAYDQDLRTVEEVLRQVDRQMREDPVWQSRILGSIEIFGIDKFGDYAMTVSARVKTRPSQQWAVGREYNRRIKEAFDAAKIEIPYPTTVQMLRGGQAQAAEDH
jgi:small conductance mechanosensitive channel